MSTTLRKSLAVFSMIGLVSVFGISQAQAGEFEDAVAKLEHAKHAAKPIEDLEKARGHLEEAHRNHHGEREEAVHQIGEAIEAARHDEHRKMDEHIDRAIHEIHEAKK